MIQVKELRKTYEVGKKRQEVLKGISLEVRCGEFISFMGPSGCGKSTLLNLLATIDDATSGDIVLGDIHVKELNDGEKAKLRKNKLSFIFQNYNLISSLTVRENILIALLVKSNRNNEIVDEIAFELGILNVMEKYPHEISGGEQQRCACARALVGGQPILLADEPTGALDSVSRKKFMKLLDKMNKKFGMTILLVTHDVFTACFSDKVYFLKDGDIEQVLEKKGEENQQFFKRLLCQVEKMEDF
jgi:ABC-type antimicrobial peptide transport system, ATPase component